MAQEVTLLAEPGRAVGSSSSRRLRREGRIPAVVYGHGSDPLSISVNGRDLRQALTTEAGLNALINLDVAGTLHLAVAKQIQRHPVRGTVEHVDFQIVSRDEVITAEVPVHLAGEATNVLKADGVVTLEITSVTVHAKPAEVPASIEVDVTDLEPGGTIRGADLLLPAGVTTGLDPEATIVSATVSTTAAEVEEAEEAAAAEAAGEAEPAAEGTTAEVEEAEEAAGDTAAGGEPAE